MLKLRMRTKFLLSMLLISAGLTCTSLLLVRHSVQKQVRLEIFADSFVLRDDRGWRITDSGRQFLASLEAPIPAHAEEQEQPSGPRVTVVAARSQVQPTLRLVVDNTRTSQPGLSPDVTRWSA